MKNFFGIIPARKGSKSIKNKNLVLIKKKRLIEHTLYNSSKSKYLKKIIVSSDDIRILNISKKFKKMIIHKRKKQISKSNSLLFEAINDVIDKFRDIIKPEDFIVLLQPTTPQRKTKAIDITRAPAIDISSGLEVIKGVKDSKLIEDFLTKCKEL